MKIPNSLISGLPCKPIQSALLVLALVTVAPVQTRAQTNGTWTNETETSSFWATGSNWLNGTAASGAGSTATITVANTAASKTVSLSTTSQTIGILNIGNPNGTGVYLINGTAPVSLTFDNNGASAEMNIAPGSGAVTMATAVTTTFNDSLLLSQNSSSLLLFNSTNITGGSGSDNKVLEHAGTGTGGVRILNAIADGATGTVSVRQNNANGTLDLRGVNTYTGGTVVDAGTLALANISNRLASTGAVTVNGGTFDVGTSSHAVGAVTVNGGTVTNGTLSGSSYAVSGGTITTILAGSGALTKSGSGTTTLSGVNTYTGGTAIDGGVLRVSERANFASRLLSFNGGTLEVTASITSGITSASNTTLNAGGGTIRVGEGLTADWGTAVISGTGALTKEGAGTLVIASGSSGSTYTGGTILKGGVVSISRTTGLGNVSGGVTFDGGTLLNTVDIAATTRATTLNAGGGTFDVSPNTTHLWNGVIGGVGNLTKHGSGVLSLGGNSTYTGRTLLENGTIALNANGSISGSSAILISAGAGLDVSAKTAGLAIASGKAIGGAGTLTGDLSLASGANFVVFDLSLPLTVTGTVLLDNSFGIGSLLGINGSALDWSFVPNGTHTLIANSGSFSNIQNFGAANQYDIGGGRFAYFNNGSLQLTVVPEPSNYALILAALALVGQRLMRRKRVA